MLPLDGVRVIDMTDGRGELCGRFLGDLGADVVLVEPPGGSDARTQAPCASGISAHFATHHYNKRGIVIDYREPAGREKLLGLLGGADLWVESIPPRELARHRLDPAAVLDALPHLVIVSVTDFGLDGPYAGYQGTDPVHLALASVLSRSGRPGHPPLLPPASLAHDASAFQAAWAAVVGLWNRAERGHGDHIDLSVFEATAQGIDPVLGTVGTARAGRSALDVERGRPSREMYPIYPCHDGYIRLVVLAVRQWRNLLAWMGNPLELADPALESVGGRNAEATLIAGHVRTLFAGLDVDGAVAEGQRRGVPVAPVMSLGSVMTAPHFVERGAIVEREVAPGVTARLPSGLVNVDGQRAGMRRRAPALGEHTEEVLAEVVEPRRGKPGAGPCRPFEGLRIVDLGIIVIGAEISRMFADLGAQVIRIENREYPDGARAAIPGRMTAAFAAGARNKLSVGINLRTEAGASILKRLVAVSDIVLENFKPGTLESLGLGWDALVALNPRLVMASSSAMGATGPWSTWLGYGPLVRATSGLTDLWRYPDVPGSFSDGVTILPDHLGARMVAAATLAATITARRTGRGVHLESAQSEMILALLGDLLVQESISSGSGAPGGQIEQSVPWGVFPCAGDDEWCVVTVRHDRDWRALVGVVGDPPSPTTADADDHTRRHHRGDLEKWVSHWTQSHTPREVMNLLQGAGIPAAPMLRPADLLDDPHLQARRFFREFDQPWLPAPIPAENGAFRSKFVAEPVMEPAPLLGQHTRQVCQEVLGMDVAEVGVLIDEGVLKEEAP